MEKFSDNPNDLQIGYCTGDCYYWICEECYEDFKNLFKWTVVDSAQYDCNQRNTSPIDGMANCRKFEK